MSNVNNFFVFMHVCENRRQRVKDLNALFSSWSPRAVPLDLDKTVQVGGGDKFLEASLVFGAYNGVSVDAVRKDILKIPWKYPESLVVLIQREEEEKPAVLLGRVEKDEDWSPVA